MDVVIVYESLYGNTRSVAEAIAEGFRGTRPDAIVTVLGVDQASTEQVNQVDLLVVGGPTHILRMTTPRTRRMSPRPSDDGGDDLVSQKGDVGEAGMGVREWLNILPAAASGSQAAAFDTRLGSVFAGGAARSISRRLGGHGYHIVTTPKGFIVSGNEGPLKAGEYDGAQLWGVRLARLCSARRLRETRGKAAS